jgi:hypothetical protein
MGHTVKNKVNNLIRATANGRSAELVLPRGVSVLYVQAATWGQMQAALEAVDGVVGVNATYYPVRPEWNVPAIVFTENVAIPVRGGQRYVINVSGFTSAIRILAKTTENE